MIAAFALSGIFVAFNEGSRSSTILQYATPIAVAIACGTRAVFSRGMHRRMWLLVAAGMASNALGDMVFLSLGMPGSASLADAFYLSTYPALFAAGAILVVARAGKGAREVFMDASVVAVTCGLVIWQFFVVNPGTANQGPLAQRIVFSTYPILDAMLVALVAALLLAPGRRSTSTLLFAIFTTLLLSADLLYNISVVATEIAPLFPLSDATYQLAYGVLIAAALHGSARQIAEPVAQPDRTMSRTRLALVALAFFIAPGFAALVPSLGFRYQLGVFLPVVLFVSALGISRIGLLVRSLERERASLIDAEGALSYQANHDGLTSLPNRTALMRRANAEIANGKRVGTMALLFVDLDRFKVVNDSLGHRVGDALLVHVADRIRSVVGDDGFVARLSGDEFVILCPSLASPADARTVADAILDAIGTPVAIGDDFIHTAASIGIAFLDGHDDALALIRDADVALYRAKDRGRATAAIFDEEMGAKVAERHELESALHGAIERDELSLVYQPIVRLDDVLLLGFEALLRWNRGGQEVSVDLLIEVAEATGLILSVGEWVLNRACADLVRLQAACPSGHPLGVSVNVSARQLSDDRLVSAVQTAIEAAGIEPRALTLELTETALINDPDRATATLDALRAVGARIEIDDFGVGYSSLSRLGAFPLDGMKIDRSFVAELGRSSSARSVIVAILALGDALGLDVVAEGVEEPSQAATLMALGCERAQGYLFARPLSLANALAFAQRTRTLA